MQEPTPIKNKIRSYLWYILLIFLAWLLIQLTSAYYASREKAVLDQVNQYQTEIEQYQRQVTRQQSDIGYYQQELTEQATLFAQQIAPATHNSNTSPISANERLYNQADLDAQATRITHKQRTARDRYLASIQQNYQESIAALQAQRFLNTSVQERRVQAEILAAHAQTLLDDVGAADDLALLLARRAVLMTWLQDGYATPSTENALQDAIDHAIRYQTFRLAEDSGPIHAVAANADGSEIVYSGNNGLLRVWDVTTGKFIKALHGHRGAVHAVAYRPDSRQIASAANDGTIIFWDVTDNYKLEKRLEGHIKPINAIAYSPDSTHLVSASADHTVRLWHVETGTEKLLLEGHGDAVQTVAYHPANKYVASGGQDMAIRIWDTNSGEMVRVMHGHTGGIRSVAYSHDGECLASASDDQTVRIWDATTGDQTNKSVYYGLRGYGNYLIFAGTTCVTATESDEIWDVMAGGEAHILHEFSAPVSSVTFLDASRNASYHIPKRTNIPTYFLGYEPGRINLATGGQDGNLRVWDIRNRIQTYGTQVYLDNVNTLAYNFHKNYILSGDDLGNVHVWRLAGDNTKRILPGETYVRSARYSPDGQHIAIGNAHGKLMIWDMRDRSMRIHGLHKGGVRAIDYRPTGGYIASGGADKLLKIWNLTNGELQEFALPGEIFSVNYSPDGKKLLAAIGQTNRNLTSTTEQWNETFSKEKTIQGNRLNVWNVFDDTLQIIQGRRFDIKAVAYDPNPDSSHIIFGGTDHMVRIWDIKNGKQIYTFTSHTGTINSVAYSPDGHYAASGSDDQTIRIWDLREGREEFVLKGHSSSITSIAFHPNGTQLASASLDNAVRVWDLETGKPLRLLTDHTKSVLSVSYSPDGTQLISAGRDETARIWDATIEDLLRRAEAHIERRDWRLTDAERIRFGITDNEDLYRKQQSPPTPTATSEATPTPSPTQYPTYPPNQIPHLIQTPTPQPDSQSRFAKPRGLMARVPQPPIPYGWTTLYTEDFENGFFDNANCHTYAYNTQTGEPRADYAWGRTSQIPPIPHSGSFAAWPAAGTQQAPITAYPAYFYTDVVCTFTDLAQADNLMVEFWAWQDGTNQDYLFVGFNTDEEPVQPGWEPLSYQGVTWPSESIVAESQLQWKKHRLYLLRDQGEIRIPAHGTVHIVWRFASPTANSLSSRGAFIDDVRIAQYRKDPNLAQACHNQRQPPQTIGKGISLPPFVSSVYNRAAATIDPAQLPPLVENFQNVNARWVRLEFTVPVSAYTGSYSPTLTDPTPPSIDLEHYDQLIDALCQGGIATLALIDYDTFVDESWRKSHRFTPAYLEKFIQRTELLAAYYRERINHWQIWNEPDLPPEGETDVPHQIEPDSYAELMVGVYQRLRNPTINPNVDPNDRILLGGLSSVNRSNDPAWGYGYDYLAALYQAIPPQQMPFYDILALHPYPGAQASHSTNPLQNPARYLYSKGEEREVEGPTLIHKFQNLIYREGDWAGKLYQPFIWITELGWRRGREERSIIGFDCESVRPRLSYEFQQFDYLYSSLDILSGETQWLDQGRLNLPAASREQRLTQSPAVATVIWHEYQDSSEWLNCVPFADNSTPDLPIMLPTWPRSFDEIWNQREATPPDRQVVGWWWGLYNGNKEINPIGCALRDYPNPVTDPNCTPRDRAILDRPIHLPHITRDADGYTNQLRLANLERYRATSLLKAYDQTGNLISNLDDLISPGGTKTYNPIEDVPIGFDGAVTLWTDSRVPALVNLERGSDRAVAAFVGQSKGAKTLYLPALMQANAGLNSWVSVQNIGDAIANVQLQYSDGTSVEAAIPANTSTRFEQATELHTQALFSAVVSSDQPIVALVSLVGSGNLAAYNSQVTDIRSPAFPHIRQHIDGQQSTIYIQNGGNQATAVTLSYIPDPATESQPCQARQTIQPGQVVPFEIGRCLPDQSFTGSAMVIENSAQQPLAGMAQQQDGTTLGAYRAFDPEQATAALSLPWIMDRHKGYSTEFTLQHVGGPETMVRCIFGYANRELTAILSLGQSFTDSQRMLFITGHTGPAFCMAEQPDAKIVAVVQERSEDGEQVMLYEGYGVEGVEDGG